MNPINNHTIFEVLKAFLPDPNEKYLGIQVHMDTKGDSYISTLASKANDLWKRHPLDRKMRDALFLTLQNTINIPSVGVWKMELICDNGSLAKPIVKLEMNPVPKRAGKLRLIKRAANGSFEDMGIQQIFDLGALQLLVVKSEIPISEKREFLDAALDKFPDGQPPVVMFMKPGDDVENYEFEWNPV